MKLFHLSDLHLGKTLGGFDLAEDQAWILDRIADRIAAEKPELLVIAGDLYDRPIPPVESIKLFDSFLAKSLAAAPSLSIVVIPGNHDSAGRLGFASSILANSGLRIVTQAGGEPAAIIDTTEGRVAVWALPFLTHSSAPWIDIETESENASGMGMNLRSQARLMELAIGRFASKRDSYAANILAAHCFAAGGRTGDTETAYVGLAEQIPLGLFAGFDYVALGHLHAPQSPDARIWYSGSPLATSVAEASSPRGFLSVEILPGFSPSVEFVPIEPLRKIRRLQGRLEDLVSEGALSGFDCDDYVEVLLTDDEIILGARDRLAVRYPRLLSMRQLAYERRFDGTVFAKNDVGANPDPLSRAMADFSLFHKEMNGSEPSAELLSLFESMAKEALSASD